MMKMDYEWSKLTCVLWNYIKKKFAFQSLSNLCAIKTRILSSIKSLESQVALWKLKSFICSSVMHLSIRRSLMENRFFFLQVCPNRAFFLYDFPFALTLAYISDLTPDPSVAFLLLPWHLYFFSFDMTYIWDCVGVFLMQFLLFTSLVDLKEMQRNTYLLCHLNSNALFFFLHSILF